jgi:hypothetical protein
VLLGRWRAAWGVGSALLMRLSHRRDQSAGRSADSLHAVLTVVIGVVQFDCKSLASVAGTKVARL